MPPLLVAVLALIAVVASRKWWLKAARRVFAPAVLWTFAVLVLMTVLGLLAWYWMNQPREVEYGARWEDITVEEDLEAIRRIHGAPDNTVVIPGALQAPVEPAPAETAPPQPAPPKQPASAEDNVLEDVPFWRPTGVAPEIAVPSRNMRAAADGNRQVEVSVIGHSKELVLTPEYLSKTPDGQLLITLDPPPTFRPGKYRLQVRAAATGNSEAVELYAQDFTWGVLAFAPDSDVYAPGETANVQLGVLDDEGVTICDAGVSIRVTSPSGKSETLSTVNGRIARNPDCTDQAVTDVPDYAGTILLSERGTYTFAITADTKNGWRTAVERVEVSARALPDITRSAMARIYPPAAYPMRITFRPSHSFTGTVTDKLPAGFVVKSSEPRATVSTDPKTGEVFVTWTGSFEKGQTYRFSYVYDAPDVSPALHLFGPMKVDGQLSDAAE